MAREDFGMPPGGDNQHQQRGMTVTQGFGTMERSRSAELQSRAQAASAQAAIQARYIMALQRPRNPDAFRVRLLHECERPGFADAALYELPRGGKKIRGLTARFAETAARLWGNLDDQARVTYEDEEMVMIAVSVTDLESNVTHSNELIIPKTTERREAGDRTVLGQRLNSEGKPVYLVLATEDEMLQRRNALVSKSKRNETIRMLPADVLEEAKSRIFATRESEIKKDPDAARKKTIDAFTELGVGPDDLVTYLGIDLQKASPAQIDELRQLYVAIKDGETTWNRVLKERATEDSSEEESPFLQKLRERAAESAKKRAAASDKKPADAQKPPAAAQEPPKKQEAKAGPEKPEAKEQPVRLHSDNTQPRLSKTGKPFPTGAPRAGFEWLEDRGGDWYEAVLVSQDAAKPATEKTDEKPTLPEAKDAVAGIIRDLTNLVGEDRARDLCKGLNFTGKKSGADRQGVVDAFKAVLKKSPALPPLGGV